MSRSRINSSFELRFSPMYLSDSRIKNINELDDYSLFMIFETIPIEELLLLRAVCRKWEWLRSEVCSRKQNLILFVGNQWSFEHLASHRYNTPPNMFKNFQLCHHCDSAMNMSKNNYLRVPNAKIALFSKFIAPMFTNLQMLFLRYCDFDTDNLCDLLQAFSDNDHKEKNPIKCLFLLVPHYSPKRLETDILWSKLSQRLSLYYKSLKHFYTNGILPQPDTCDWSFMNRVNQLNLANCHELPSLNGNINLKAISLFVRTNVTHLINLNSTLTFLDICFSDTQVLFSVESLDKLASMQQLKELRLHNSNTLFFPNNDFASLTKLCRKRSLKFYSVRSLTLDFYFDYNLLPDFLQYSFPNLEHLNVTFLKLNSYEMLDYLDDSKLRFCAWINGTFNEKPIYTSITKLNDRQDGRKKYPTNNLYFDLTSCPYVHLEDHFNFAYRFVNTAKANEKRTTINLMMNLQQATRLCKTLNTRIKRKVLSKEVRRFTHFRICHMPKMITSRAMLESNIIFRTSSRTSRHRRME